jgi:hypothetical protein
MTFDPSEFPTRQPISSSPSKVSSIYVNSQNISRCTISSITITQIVDTHRRSHSVSDPPAINESNTGEWLPSIVQTLILYFGENTHWSGHLFQSRHRTVLKHPNRL